jgi:hypothetical protein
VIPGDEDYRRGRESLAQPLELPEREDDGVVGGANGMKEIASDNHHVRPRGNHPVNGSTESFGDVGFPLVDAARSLPVVLPDSEVRIGDMSQFHGLRMGPNALKSKHLTAADERLCHG